MIKEPFSLFDSDSARELKPANCIEEPRCELVEIKTVRRSEAAICGIQNPKREATCAVYWGAA
jgi:hypothetical protein